MKLVYPFCSSHYTYHISNTNRSMIQRKEVVENRLLTWKSGYKYWQLFTKGENGECRNFAVAWFDVHLVVKRGIQEKSGTFTWIFLRCRNIDILPQYEKKKRDFDSSLKVKKSPKEVCSPEHPVNCDKTLTKKLLQLTTDTFEVLFS